MANKNFNNNGFEYIDLELPSGTLWATKNVGADKATDYGLYFQWGDTQGYYKARVGVGKSFNMDNYIWGLDEIGAIFSKYKKGGILELEDDAANNYMGGDWHLPNPDQIKELLDNTTTEWTSKNGVKGILFISKKNASKTIFFPAAGNAYSCSVWHSENYGHIWSSMLSTGSAKFGYALGFGEYGASLELYSREYGFSVRGVIG